MFRNPGLILVTVLPPLPQVADCPQHSDTSLRSEIDNFDIQRYGAVSRLS